MNNINVLLVDDDAIMRKTLRELLKEKGCTVIEAEDGEKALEIFERQKENINLVLLDVMMPKLDGWSVLRNIKKESRVPVIIITARESDEDELFGFELGADEYITKPYNIKIVEARIMALLNKVNIKMEKSKIYGELNIDFEGRIVTLKDKKVNLALREYELLVYLVQNENIVLSREKILNAVWKYDYYGDTRTIDNHVKKLRNKLKKAGNYIETVRGIGYKFKIK